MSHQCQLLQSKAWSSHALPHLPQMILPTCQSTKSTLCPSSGLFCFLSCSSNPQLGCRAGLGHSTRAGRAGGEADPQQDTQQLLFCTKPLPGTKAKQDCGDDPSQELDDYEQPPRAGHRLHFLGEETPHFIPKARKGSSVQE